MRRVSKTEQNLALRHADLSRHSTLRSMDRRVLARLIRGQFVGTTRRLLKVDQKSGCVCSRMKYVAAAGDR